MKITFKNPFAVNENDTIGTGFMKKMTEGYVKGVTAAGLGLGVVAIVIKNITKKKDSKKEDEENIDEKVERKLKKLEKLADEFEER